MGSPACAKRGRGQNPAARGACAAAEAEVAAVAVVLTLERELQPFLPMTSKARKRVVLPTRPSPPTVEQILEDVNGALPSDPVFTSFAPQVLEELPATQENKDPEAERERQYQQSRSYVAMNHRLQIACGLLKQKCEELRQAGDSLEQDILEMKQRTLSGAQDSSCLPGVGSSG